MKTVALTIASALLVAAPAAVAQEEGFEPIPGDVSAFLVEQFNMAPAQSVAERIPHTTCRKDIYDVPFTGLWEGGDLIGEYYCIVDYGCDQVDGVPVMFTANGALTLGPESADRLVAMYCAESISDPARREKLSEEVQQGG